MWRIGSDLHSRTAVFGAVHDSGECAKPKSLACQQTSLIIEHVRHFQPFRAVIEATSSYRWMYDLISPEGTVLLAHPSKLRLMVQRRAKTDKLGPRFIHFSRTLLV